MKTRTIAWPHQGTFTSPLDGKEYPLKCIEVPEDWHPGMGPTTMTVHSTDGHRVVMEGVTVQPVHVRDGEEVSSQHEDPFLAWFHEGVGFADRFKLVPSTSSQVKKLVDGSFEFTIKPDGNDTRTLGDLLGEVEQVAKVEFDGHYTILRFTTGFKVGFGTINVDGDRPDKARGWMTQGRLELEKTPVHSTLQEALAWLLQTKHELAS